MKKVNNDLHHLFSEDVDLEKTQPKADESNFSLRRSQDVYEHACSITAWQQIYDQLNPGVFRGRLSELLFDGLQVFEEYTSLALRQSCMVWPNAFWFGIPNIVGQEGQIAYQAMSAHEVAVRPGGKEFELSTPDDYNIMGIVISEEVLHTYANLLSGHDELLTNLDKYSLLHVDVEKKAQLWSVLQNALNYANRYPDCMQTENAKKVFSHQVIAGLLALLESAHPVDVRKIARRENYQKMIYQAREYVLSKQGEPVTVIDLCQEMKVSRRTLQYGFQEVLGINPNTWLKVIRLNAVRRELENPRSQYNSVSDAAMAWGFWHLSQFSADYQRLFADKPSNSLAARSRLLIY